MIQAAVDLTQRAHYLPWLGLYTLWYQVPGFDNSANVDLIAIYLTEAATLLLLAVPFIPGLRNVPEVIPLHRLVWRRWNTRHGGSVPGGHEGDGGGGGGGGGAGGAGGTPGNGARSEGQGELAPSAPRRS